MAHEIVALGWGKALERGRDQAAHVIEGSGPRRPQERFQLRKRQFDRIEVGAVGRQEPELRTDRLDRRAHTGVLVGGEVIQHHDIADRQRRREDLLDVREERRRVDRPVEDRRRPKPAEAQRGDHGVRLPVTARRVIPEPGAHRAAAVPPEQVSRHATFVEKHVLADVPERLPRPPLAAGHRDIRPALFVGVYRFF